MFHRSSLGALGETLPCDLHGNVPQQGDRPEDFTWDPRTEWTAPSWSAFVEGAVQATTEAEEAAGGGGVASLLGAASLFAAQQRARNDAAEKVLRQQIEQVRQRLAPLVDEAEASSRKSGERRAEAEGLARALALIEAWLRPEESC